jgi:DNA ligase D-like protein (predicted ligase)/DNA ligase D-like protein (predicted 3'-phosphoesterase)
MTPRYKPMMVKDASAPFSDKDWLFEIKWDGFRAIAYLNDDLSLRSRNGKELINDFPELTELKRKANNVVLDGEIVIFNNGKPDFQALLERGKTKPNFRVATSSAVYVVFDILEKDGKPLVDLPLLDRKRVLRDSVQEGDHVVLGDFVAEKGETYYKVAIEKGLEGVVAKEKNSPYAQGLRSGSWLKIKKLRTMDCVIFGYTQGSGSRKSTFGALLLGLYGGGGKVVYIGKVGTGFTQKMLEAISLQLQSLKTGDAPFIADASDVVTWVAPELVCEVHYLVITNDGRLRMARFERLREDKQPSECTTDQLADHSLKEYSTKRDFTSTAEPSGKETDSPTVKGAVFVVQEHHARRLHYDFRLERGGVLKSWAVPKGIPEESNDKRLAVQTEDHPLAYAAFEGDIPEGQYGAGKVIIWDTGVYETKVWTEKMIEVILHGKRLSGRFVLVPLKRGGEKNWLMLKAKE